LVLEEALDKFNHFKLYENVGGDRVINEIVIKPKVAPTSVREKIEAAFKRDAILDASQIKVQADGGKVTLTGSVRSARLGTKEQVNEEENI